MTMHSNHRPHDTSQEAWVQTLLAITAMATVVVILLWSLG